MKLSKKIPLLCGGVMAVVLIICSAFLSVQSREQLIGWETERAKEQLYTLVNDFGSKVNRDYHWKDSEMVKRAVLSYHFSKLAKEGDVLCWNGELIYPKNGMDPRLAFPDNSAQWKKVEEGQVGIARFRDGNRRLLILGQKIGLGEYMESCTVYRKEEINHLYDSAARLALRYGLVTALALIFGVGVIFLLVRRVLRPLGQLQAAAGRIAGGSYQERTGIHSTDEVGALAVDFDRMAQAVEHHIGELTETANRQQLFIGAVSHEFKTPLTALILTADTLQNTYLEEDEQQEALGRMGEQCRALERMVQKLLKLITLGEAIQTAPTDIPELLERVAQTAQGTLKKHGVTLETRCLVSFLPLDADLMCSALVNLVDNAAKASQPGQKIFLQADEAGFTVTDSGRGMSREDAGRATQAFFMVDKARSRKQGGAGLGLALVEKTVQAHGGELTIESELGQGTTVRIVIKR